MPHLDPATLPSLHMLLQPLIAATKVLAWQSHVTFVLAGLAAVCCQFSVTRMKGNYRAQASRATGCNCTL
jgi:hypothetical protein